MLLVHPKQKSSSLPSGLRFRILTRLDPAAFSLTKLAPDRNNLRSVCTRTAADEPQLLPTPTYNTSILEVPLHTTCLAVHFMRGTRELHNALCCLHISLINVE